MPPKPPSPAQLIWFKWKALRLPWRRRILAGYDLDGNTYWEFRVSGVTSGRLRRIVEYPTHAHHSEVRVPPIWHQWLRHTRAYAPSKQEQTAELLRQQQMKVLAAQADARWEAKPRLTDAPAPAAAALPSGTVAPSKDAYNGLQHQQKTMKKVSDELGELAPLAANAQARARREAGEPGGAPQEGPVTSAKNKTEGNAQKDPWGAWQRAKETKQGWQPKAWTPGGKN